MDDKVLNICFHGIGTPARELEPGEDRYWVTKDQFHEILDEIATWPRLRISFDDGNSSDLEFGLEALLQRNLTATFFVLAGRFSRPGSLDESEVRHLRSEGMRIGSHGMDHVSWRHMPADVRQRELIMARQSIDQAAGVTVDEAAVPLGRYDRRLLKDLRHLGYSTVYTSDRRQARPGSWLQPRFSVRCDDSVQTLRAEVLTALSFEHRVPLAVKGFLKRLR